MPTVSVIVPVYNVKELLPLCLDSITRQTFTDFECILVDDGSTDGSAAVCDEYAARDKRFRVIHKTNGGVCSARNTGIASAKADYILFCDQDDLLAPRLLDLATNAQKEHPGDLIAWAYTRDQAEFSDQPADPSCKWFDCHHMLDYMASNALTCVWNKLLPRKLLDTMPVCFDESLVGGGEDFDFITRFFPLFFETNPEGRVCQINAPLYYWNAENEKSVSLWSSNFKNYSLRQLDYFKKVKLAFPNFYEHDEEQIVRCFNRLIQPMVFGFVTAKQNKESLDAFWRSPELAEILTFLQEHRWYLPLYPPLLLHSAWLGRKMLDWMDNSPRLYSLSYGFFYHLLAHGWKHL